MADVFKIVGDLFGIGQEETNRHVVKAPIIDPADERKALAELDGSIAAQSDDVKLNTRVPRSVDMTSRKDGSVDFRLLFSQAGLASTDVSAEQAVKILGNIENALPASITDPEERKRLLRSLVIATVSVPGELESLMEDAKQKSNLLRTVVRAKLDSAADFKQRSLDRIRQLNQQIVDTEAGISKSENQFLSFSAACKERQSLYEEVVNLLTNYDVSVIPSEPKNTKQ